MSDIEGVRGERRLYPRFWDYCAYMLECLRKALADSLDAELARNPDAVVIDYGCGERPYETLVAGRGSRYIGVDLGANPQANVFCDDNGHVPLEDRSADLVMSIQVLEHVVDVSTYLAECFRLLKPGGLLVLSTHGCWTYHPYPRDVRRWTCWGLKHEIEQHGLRGALWKLRPLSTPIIHGISTIAQVLMACGDLITPRAVREQNSAVYVVGARKPSSG